MPEGTWAGEPPELRKYQSGPGCSVLVFPGEMATQECPDGHFQMEVGGGLLFPGHHPGRGNAGVLPEYLSFCNQQIKRQRKIIRKSFILRYP